MSIIWLSSWLERIWETNHQLDERELKNNYELKETKLRSNEAWGEERVEKNFLELILRMSVSVSVRRAMFWNCINEIKPTHSLFYDSKLWLIKGNGAKGYWWKSFRRSLIKPDRLTYMTVGFLWRGVSWKAISLKWSPVMNLILMLEQSHCARSNSSLMCHQDVIR